MRNSVGPPCVQQWWLIRSFKSSSCSSRVRRLMGSCLRVNESLSDSRCDVIKFLSSVRSFFPFSVASWDRPWQSSSLSTVSLVTAIIPTIEGGANLLLDNQALSFIPRLRIDFVRAFLNVGNGRGDTSVGFIVNDRYFLQDLLCIIHTVGSRPTLTYICYRAASDTQSGPWMFSPCSS